MKFKFLTGLRLVLTIISNATIILLLVVRPGIPATVQPVTVLSQRAQPLSLVEVLRMPPVDNQKLLERDKGLPTEGVPLRFAEALGVDVTPLNSGTWETLEGDMSLWRLRIVSPGAHSLNLGFTKYFMPPGGHLFVYTPDYKTVAGPFTEKDNEEHGQLWTPLVPGSAIVIEVSLPAAVESQLELALSKVNHAYRKFESQPQKIGGNTSGSCNVDVVCPEGNDWRDEIRSVGAYTIRGTDTCSGALVNNAAQDLTPYFLTADHCEVNVAQAPSVVVYWNYQNSTCRTPDSHESGQPGDGQLTEFNTGAILRADYRPSDMTLLELDDPINPAFRVHWAGWDNTGADATSATGIHHPRVSEKRISFENDPTTTTSDGTHIRVEDWDLGTTEPGSSGSPLFNPDHRIIGQLHTGLAACGNDESDWYGRFFVSWTGGGTDASRLSNWLDWSNTGVALLDGTDMPGGPPSPGWYRNGTETTTAGTTILYEDNTVLITWDFSYVYQHPGKFPLYWYAEVVYYNKGNQTLPITCNERTDPSRAKEHKRGAGNSGSVSANETFCSRNPIFTDSIEPAGLHYEWAIFRDVPRKGSEVSLEWGPFGSSPWVDPWRFPVISDPPAECPPELVELGTCQPAE